MKKILIILVLVVAAGAAWYLGSPLFFDTEVQEDFPVLDRMPTPEELAAMPPDELSRIEDTVMEMAADSPDVVMEEGMPASPAVPVLFAEGVFQDADSFHRGSGTARIYELPDGTRLLRLEDFSVTNGPDLRVLLAAGARPQSSDDLGEYLELAPLKGNKGDQNYTIPASADVDVFNSVVIYCKPFHVVFSVAPLTR